ncbi:MAG: Uma2 family endonuclease [Alphaproteobacteria bacterium]|nr:Uma2 family endonuclease [Alphaproteobacteria bacterium]
MADTSLAFDRGLKLALYARHRIPEIWIVNIPGATLEIFALQRSKATPPTRI